MNVRDVAIRFLSKPRTTRRRIMLDIGMPRDDYLPDREWNAIMLSRVTNAGRLPDLIAHRDMFGSVHWVGDAPTSLHGNGAMSFERTTRSKSDVTCPLCLTLLAHSDDEIRSTDA